MTSAMLSHLSIRNFAIASHIEIDFRQGMSVLTGETGAGKSILLDALGLALGDRADTSMVRHGETKAEISAIFDIQNHAEAKAWLETNDLESDDECILRRVITAEGRSRAYINGQPCPLNNLKAIGEQLIDIHSQHEHQSLLEKDKHRDILDNYIGNKLLAEEVAERFKQWHEKAAQYELLVNNKEETEARIQLLSFQVDELDKLGLQDGEIEQLEKEQSSLSHAENLLVKANEALAVSDSDDGGAISLVNKAKLALDSLPTENKKLSEARALFEEAYIQLDEANHSLRQFVEDFELDPARLAWIEERLSAAYQLARKHHCNTEDLNEIHFKLASELKSFSEGGLNTETLKQDLVALKQSYFEQAQALRAVRQKQAKQLETRIAEQLAKLSMQNVRFEVNFQALEERQYSKHGLDAIEFLISTNPGQPARPLGKVASGGELSRISLAIQVVIAQTSTISSMVFDEVDVGIGGGTAEVVGTLLKQLGEKGQVICVTHLPQVASQGENHFVIGKTLENESVHSFIRELNDEERTEEIARMLGGVTITQQTLAHAKEMLKLD
jgi:DNA repair protein RecN (Recombination protein N)